MTPPTAEGWTGSITLGEVLTLRDQAFAKAEYGPFTLFMGRGWRDYLDVPYTVRIIDGTVSTFTQTLRQRLQSVELIVEVKLSKVLGEFDTMIARQGTGEVI